MPVRDQEDDEGPPDRPWLTFSVFISCFTGLLLQVLSFAYLYQGLCNNVPADRAYCTNSTDNSGKLDNDINDKPKGDLSYIGYQLAIGFGLFTEFLVVVKVSCKIECCVSNFCIPGCASLWECCVCCGNCWYIIAGISVIVNLLGVISVCMTVPFSDMLTYIIGFRLGFGNLLFGFIKITVWTIYLTHRQSCCPDSGYYLGSSRRLSATYINTTKVTTEVTTSRRPDGTIVSENSQETGREDLGTRKADLFFV